MSEAEYQEFSRIETLRNTIADSNAWLLAH
jgi:hypothetical protein